jgi:hypothetical protein
VRRKNPAARRDASPWGIFFRDTLELGFNFGIAHPKFARPRATRAQNAMFGRRARRRAARRKDPAARCDTSPALHFLRDTLNLGFYFCIAHPKFARPRATRAQNAFFGRRARTQSSAAEESCSPAGTRARRTFCLRDTLKLGFNFRIAHPKFARPRATRAQNAMFGRRARRGGKILRPGVTRARRCIFARHAKTRILFLHRTSKIREVQGDPRPERILRETSSNAEQRGGRILQPGGDASPAQILFARHAKTRI